MEKKITMVENANITKLSNQIISLRALIMEIEKKYEAPAWELLKVRYCLVNTTHKEGEIFIHCVQRYMYEGNTHDLLTGSMHSDPMHSDTAHNIRTGNSHCPLLCGEPKTIYKQGTLQ